MAELEFTRLSIDEIKPYPGNARIHPRDQMRKLMSSVSSVGIASPLLIDEQNEIIAGHGRLEAAKALGLKEVPVIRITGLDEAQKKALRIADNRIAEGAGWDYETLALELSELIELEPDFDIEVTGFETAEIDILFDGEKSVKADPADNLKGPDFEGPVVSRDGDLWQLGLHRLICGDARLEDTYAKLLGEERAAAVITDPPYNVVIDGHVSGSGKIQHAEFKMASGEMSMSEFTGFLGVVLVYVAAFSRDGSIHYIFMDWRHIEELITAGRAAYDRLLNVCVWNKTNGGMGSFYRSKHEFVFVFKKGTAPHINNIELGRHGRYRTNVWDYAGVNTFRKGRMEELSLHPTVKPVPLVADAIRDCTRRKDIVLDPFAGSGTVFLAAERTGRIARGIELDPKYVDVAIRRFQRDTGIEAIHGETGLTFSGTAAERAGQAAENDGGDDE